MTDNIVLITGAAGKTGRAISAALARRGAAVRVLIQPSRMSIEPPVEGAAETVGGDITSRDDLRQALEGVSQVYHICPNVHPLEVEIARGLLDAALDAGTSRVVFHSVLHPQVEAMPHHWKKMRVEELLFASGLDFTILQPAAYMQNTLAQVNSIRTRGIYSTPYSVNARLSMADLADVAEVAALVLTSAGHSRAIYELAGAEALSQVEVAAVFSQVLGLPVRAEEQSRVDWEAGARRTGMDAYAVETLLKMFIYYDQHGLIGNPNVLTSLLGRAPTTFEAFLHRTLPA